MKIDFTDYIPGAALATDLVNTSPQVRGAGDTLSGTGALREFLAENGVDWGEPSPDDLKEVLTLRSRVRGILETEDEDETAEAANDLVARAAGGPSLERDGDGRWRWYVGIVPDASFADRLAVLVGTGLLGVLEVLSHDRFRYCASPLCEGMFVDTSRAGRRRYCTPSLCGNRLNVANHRARHSQDRP
ncbi:CGNR zinc finger domain-containing protein [Nocardiopsis sp. L17-MgMaSL7]|uniref:CGNR zinc finger domain-containing protein n=1 Tax=Nocardiopsis sp. L17-MgMaSL7 TaxID=1938893 RepID=UPI000D70B69A|nr:CGNR zinc finger domain-containing protein [Nocardiopsis sp. L17-MgMaSL7]PWV45678.1 putative stress-induced transcription regulator [Nocardiopsis sp. L17-MgMaSL7]